MRAEIQGEKTGPPRTSIEEEKLLERSNDVDREGFSSREASSLFLLPLHPKAKRWGICWWGILKTISARDVRVHFSIQILDPGEKREFDVAKLFCEKDWGKRITEKERE